jgi:branched-chain amino acid transport system ATP-binding protein
MLALRNVTKDFGGLRAVDGVTFTVARGTISGLIGPNGAGKSTLFNVLAGAIRPSGGEVLFDGERIDQLPNYRISSKGLMRTFQIPRPFGGMTVLENLMLVPAGQTGERFWNTWLRGGAVRAEERRIRDKARDILEFIGLIRLADEPARILSGGQLKLVELGRALMADPKMVLLDEPGAGVNPTLLGQIIERIVTLNERGITFLIIEHNMDLIMNLCRPVIVMAAGKLLMEGEPRDVQSDPRVLDAYLGGMPA